MLQLLAGIFMFPGLLLVEIIGVIRGFFRLWF